MKGWTTFLSSGNWVCHLTDPEDLWAWMQAYEDKTGFTSKKRKKYE